MKISRSTYDSVPDELKRLNQWVCWKAEPDTNRPGKIKKIPINAKTGGQAQSNNPDTWCSFDQAVKAAPNYSGIGFMFANGYFGVDIDGIENEIYDYMHGHSDNIVAEFIHSLQSYSEWSVSGKGLHVICRGELPAGGRRKNNVEMYQSGRYFIVTGNNASEYAEINECTTAIKALHEKYIGGGQIPTTGIVINNEISLSDSDIIELAGKSKRGQMFNDLYAGKYDMYFASHSEADMSLCNMLAFYSGRDPAVMDRIFRSSGLMRDKWDRKQSGSTYGAITISKAIRDCQNTYTQPKEYSVSFGVAKSNEKPKKLYSFDDTGNAERFYDKFKESVRYNYVKKCWMYYDGRRWKADETGVAKRLSDEIVEEMKHDLSLYTNASDDPEAAEKQFLKHIKYSRSSKGKTAMLKESEHVGDIPILPKAFDKNIYLLNTPNGSVNLKSGELLKHSKDNYLSKITNAEYTDKDDCPLWKAFLNDIFGSDQELIQYIQKSVGYSISGSTDEQCMFFCYGIGGNGKSVFLNVISDILGDYSCNIQPETLMVKRIPSNSANSDIARLKSVRFVTSIEPNEGERLNEGLVKQLTGGDIVTARFLYEKEFEFAPEFKIWIGTNHKPIVRGTDEGIWRRMRLIPFTVSIPKEKQDKLLKFKLRQEYPAILNWMVEGCLMWQRQGLEPPESVKRETDEYRTSMDVVQIFINECCIVGAGEVQASAAYKAYRQWAQDYGEYAMSSTKFGREFGKRFEKYMLHGRNIYRSIALRPDYEPYGIKFG